MKKLFLSYLTLLFGGWLWAQEVPTQAPAPVPGQTLINTNYHKMPPLSPAGRIDPTQAKPDPWQTRVTHLGHQHGSDRPKDYLDSIKAIKTAVKLDQPVASRDQEDGNANLSLTPVVITDFQGNLFDGSSPPDNTVAVSDNGFVVSATNSKLTFYSQTGTLLGDQSLGSFFAPLNLSGSYFDPKVLYDPAEDKFILIALSGTTPSNSTVAIAFSTSNDPTANWWLYTMPGNPLNNNTWFDFPSIGVSTSELYISGNNFSPSGTFDQVIIYQIEKANGFAGGNINWVYWNDVRDANNQRDFTIKPIGHGQDGNIGPGIFMVSTDVGGGSTAMLYYTTAVGSQSPQLVVNSVTLPQSYSAPGDGFQLGTNETIMTNDCRTLSGFWLDDHIHFVFNTDRSGGFTGLYYARMDVSNVNSITPLTATFGLSGYDYAFPSVASFSSSSTDQTALLGFLRTSNTSYPEFRVVSIDNSMTWSGSVQVRAGDSYVNFNNSSENRWGDYSGISRRHITSGVEVWVSGCYGDDFNGGFINILATWIGKIGTSGSTPSPPVADFFGVPTTVNVGDNVTFNDLSTNNPTSWSWDFGDGQSSNFQNPIHSYGMSGVYPVSLTATNAGGSDTETKSNYITVSAGPQAPVADFTANQTTVNVGQTVFFTDLSTNNPTTWFWDFNNGQNSSQQNPSVTYNSPGTYTISLTATNPAGTDIETKVNYITVTSSPQPPMADFTSNTTTPTVGQSVNFTDLSTNNPTSWLWDFGNGQTSSSANPTTTYSSAGTYTVTLTVSNASGSDIESKVDYITVGGGSGLNADFTANSTQISAGGLVNFTDLSTGGVNSWTWSFPGGTPATSIQQNPIVIYSSQGSYDVSLIVSDGSASSSTTKSGYINVGPVQIETAGRLVDFTLAPNPTEGKPIRARFTVPSIELLDFTLIDPQGKRHLLLRHRVKAGENELSFGTAHLTPGTYYLMITDLSQTPLHHETILVTD